jgi:hypothetical protein
LVAGSWWWRRSVIFFVVGIHGRVVSRCVCKGRISRGGAERYTKVALTEAALASSEY